MNPRWALAAVLAAAWPVLGGCAGHSAPRETGSAKPSLIVVGVVIENGLAYGVTDVIIEEPASGAFAGCGNLLPRTSCSNRFEELEYRGNPVVVRWKEHGVSRQTPEFVAQARGEPRLGEYILRVVIFAPGQAGAELEPAPDSGLTSR